MQCSEKLNDSWSIDKCNLNSKEVTWRQSTKKTKNTFENLHKLAKTADMESFLSKLAGLWSTVL